MAARRCTLCRDNSQGSRSNPANTVQVFTSHIHDRIHVPPIDTNRRQYTSHSRHRSLISTSPVCLRDYRPGEARIPPMPPL